MARAEDVLAIAKSSKESKGIRIEVGSPAEQAIIIRQVGEGPCMDCHRANPDEPLKPYGRIGSVNGKKSTATRLMSKLHSAGSSCGEVALRVRRPKTQDLSFFVNGNSQLGIDLVNVRDTLFIVAGITVAGVVPEHNKPNPDKTVGKGDLLCEVNGISQDLKKVASAVAQSTGKCAITFQYHD